MPQSCDASPSARWTTLDDGRPANTPLWRWQRQAALVTWRGLWWPAAVLVPLCACGVPLEPAAVDGIWVATRYYGQSLPAEAGSAPIRVVVLADTLRLEQGRWHRVTARTVTDLSGATYLARQPRYEPLDQRGAYALGRSEVRLQVDFCEVSCDDFWVGKLREDGRLVFDGEMEYIRG